MKYAHLRNRLAALEARLNLKPVRIVIAGGLPPDYAPPKLEPGGSDLRSQHRMFTRRPETLAGASNASDPASAETSPLPKRTTGHG